MKKIIITGNIGKDPESRADKDGNQFVVFSVGIAVGTKQTPKTDWVQVSANGKLAEIVRMYAKKGTKILVEGFPTTSIYINKENEPVAILNVYASIIELLSKRENDTDESLAHSDDEEDNSESPAHFTTQLS